MKYKKPITGCVVSVHEGGMNVRWGREWCDLMWYVKSKGKEKKGVDSKVFKFMEKLRTVIPNLYWLEAHLLCLLNVLGTLMKKPGLLICILFLNFW